MKFLWNVLGKIPQRYSETVPFLTSQLCSYSCRVESLLSWVCIFWNRFYATHFWGTANAAKCELGWRKRWGCWIRLLWSGSVMSQYPANLNISPNSMFSHSHYSKVIVSCQFFWFGIHFRHPNIDSQKHIFFSQCVLFKQERS